MRIIEQEIFKYEELSDAAKEKAREWFTSSDDFETGYVYEDAATIGALMGIDLCLTRVTLMGGGHRYDPTIYWEGFSSQGDGACFESTYKYAKGGVKAVSDYTGGRDAELIRIAKGLQDIQRKHFYQLRARTTHRGRYYHSGCMNVDVSYYDDEYRDIGEAEDEVTQLLRDFADWIYERLEAEYDYQTSDEVVEECILANQYEFDEAGNIH